MRGMNKRGQEMTLGTIIAIVLGIAVLVFLIFGFSQGWGNLWDRITNLGGTNNNVDTIVQACALRCSAGDKYGFCQEERKVNYGDGTWEKGSCQSLKEKSNKISIDSCDISCGENFAEFESSEKEDNEAVEA